MSDRIELADEEVRDLAKFVDQCIGACADTEGIVRGVFTRLNRTRAGAPLGTVRASSDGVMLLIRVNVNEPECSTAYVPRWVIVNLRTGTTSLSDEDYPPPDWPVVYSPEES